VSNRPKTQQTRAQSRTTEATQESRSSLVWIGVAAIVAIAVVVGVLVSLSGDDSPGADWALETGFAEIIGTPLPPFGDGPDPAVGTPAPTLRGLSARTGDVLEMIPDDGSVKLIGFFAHWCPSCQREIPKVVEALEAEPLPDGVELLAVSTSVEQGGPNYPPSDWFVREGWTAPVMVDTEDGRAASGFGLTSFPYWVVVGADGNVVARVAGELNEDQFGALVTVAADAR
jgi:cytochrome c biogenesis protein CcmG, thiol:disulfide interchange protein DsbE